MTRQVIIVYRILIDWSNKTKLYRYITPLQNVSTIIISHISRRIKRKKKKEYRNNISISRPENVQSCRSRLTRLQAGL